MMSKLRSWATPLTMGSFLISALSGVILFFHLDIGLMKPAHEWLSWFMILGVGAHVVINWPAFKKYFQRPVALSIIGLFVVLTALSFFSFGDGGNEGGNTRATAMKSMRLLQSAPISVVAELNQTSSEAIVEKLKAAGLTVDGPEQSLQDIGKDQQREARELLSLILQ